MKIKSLSLVLFIFYVGSGLKAQLNPPELKFQDGLKENWKYISYDSNFVKFPDNNPSSPYGGRFVFDYHVKGDYILILEGGDSQRPFIGHDGSLIHKLNYKTGKLKWVDHNNMYVGLEYHEDYLGGYMKVNENDEIELVGLRSPFKIEKKKPGYSFYGLPVRRKIDFNTGKLLETKVATKEIKNRAAVNGIGFLTAKNRKGEMFRITDRVTFPDTIVHENIEFHLIDDSLNIVYPPYDSILHNSNLKSLEYSLSYPAEIWYVSDDTILVVFGTMNPADQSYSPTELLLNWIYIGDKDNIHVVKSVDVAQDLYFPQYEEYIGKWILNEGIVMSQRIISYEPDVPYKWFTWMTWYDHKGNRQAKIDWFVIDNHYYIEGAQPLFIKDGYLFVSLRKTEEEHTYHDIIKINPGLNNYEKVGSLVLKNIEGVTYWVSKTQLLPEDKAMIQFWVNQEIGDGVTNFVYFYNFNLKDLGIITNFTDADNAISGLTIYPNPALNTISITSENNSASTIEIIDRLGRAIMKDKSPGCEEKTFDISGFNSGLYFVRLVDESGKIVGRGKFVKE
jgi:hypothetical protein